MPKTHGKAAKAALLATAGLTVDPNPCPLGGSFTVSATGLESTVVYSLKLIDRVGDQFPAATATADEAGNLGPLASGSVEVTA